MFARKAKPLTNTEVQQAKPKGKEFNLVDGDGLALWVKPNGSKLWILNYYRPYTKKRTSLSLGTYPSTMLAGARQKRTELRKLLTADNDPKEYRVEQARVSGAFLLEVVPYLRLKPKRFLSLMAGVTCSRTSLTQKARRYGYGNFTLV